jgi:hypothetical protein
VITITGGSCQTQIDSVSPDILLGYILGRERGALPRWTDTYWDHPRGVGAKVVLSLRFTDNHTLEVITRTEAGIATITMKPFEKSLSGTQTSQTPKHDADGCQIEHGIR